MHFKKVKGILSAQNGMNLCRGCTHGCIYCDSRSRCYGMEHDFEDVEIKINAPELLEAALKKKRRRCMIGTGAMSDPYIPLEESLKITRACLEIIDRHRFGLAIQTKSSLILKDLDILKSINRKARCVVEMTLTTFDEELCKIIEPGVSTTRERFETLKTLRDNNIPTVVWLCPVLPFINDTPENIRGILDYCAEANVYGIICFGMGTTMREGSRDYFYKMLDRNFPGLRARYENRYGLDYEIPSVRSRELTALFRETCEEYRIVCDNEKVFGFMREFDEQQNPEQPELF